ncbi:MAG: hypothetical protein R3314_07170 [Longimicrobiales bacterium]|nr:hypothetical protein [Longimicrobiales bacterium]
MTRRGRVPRRSAAGPPGVTLPELLLVAWLFALVLIAAARFAGAQGRLAVLGQERGRAADVVRTTDLVLNGELRYAAAPDMVAGRDSVRLRAVRGGGTICGGGSEISIRYRGARRPDPTKDSALIITADTTDGTVHQVTAVASDTACGGYRLGVSPPAGRSVGMVLIFETGAYYLSRGALRYRRGRGGRQPVTEAVLENPWFESATGKLRARLPLHPDTFLRLPLDDEAATIRLLSQGGAP